MQIQNKTQTIAYKNVSRNTTTASTTQRHRQRPDLGGFLGPQGLGGLRWHRYTAQSYTTYP